MLSAVRAPANSLTHLSSTTSDFTPPLFFISLRENGIERISP
jgi:hypothetical protein